MSHFKYLSAVKITTWNIRHGGGSRTEASEFLAHHSSKTGPFAGDVDPIELYCIKKNGDTRPKQWSQTKLVYDYLLNELCSGKAKPIVNPTDDW